MKLNILDVLLPLYLIISLGYFCKRRGFPSKHFWEGVEQLTYYLLFPALIFSNLARANIDSGLISQILLVIAIPTVLLGASQLFGLLHPKISGATFSSMFQGAVRNNTTIGLVIAGLIMPGQGVAVMALIMTIMVIINNVLCVGVLVRFGDANKRSKSALNKPIWINIVSNPLIQASIAGLVINFLGLRLPDPLHQAIYFLGQTGLPLALLTVGAGLSLGSMLGKTTAMGLSIFAKLILSPILVYAFLQFIPVTPQNAQILLLYSALPTAMSAYVLASQLGGDKQTMAQIITLQTLFAALTIPIVLIVMQNLS